MTDELTKICDKMVELDIFKKTTSLPDSYFFSNGFKDYYNTLIRGKEKMDNELFKPKMIEMVILSYLERFHPEKLGTIVTDEEMKLFVTAVGNIIRLEQEKDVGYRE